MDLKSPARAPERTGAVARSSGLLFDSASAVTS
jgi:hypothetical protein